ncbi:putative bifunctional diguanylate cyclase/phosphodiesterase [Kineococcus sp. DHX-1]|uniref:putative bifunctional diguanylate cyclase/phosphodiesterase n=1 Tax=Kineococcus sp. DHX-1 TaxID=3349638 RepID=UPI0036D31503
MALRRDHGRVVAAAVRDWYLRGDVVDRARRLFLLVAVGSTLLTAALAEVDTGAGHLVVLAAGAVLLASWTHGYLRAAPRPRLDLLDAVDAVALAAFVAAVSEPSTVLGFLFWAVWFRSQYGSGRAALVRCTAHVAAVALGVAAWWVQPANTDVSEVWGVLGAFPVVFLGLAVARRVHTASSRIVRDQLRENALSTLGDAVVGIVDRTEVVRAGMVAAQEIAAATPGLRLALIRVRDGVADADLRAGDWAAPLVCGPVGDAEPSPLLTDAALDAGAGLTTTPGRWTWIASPVPVGHTWLVAGGDGLAAEGLDAASLLSNHIALALNRCAAHAALVQRADTDSLTGLANRGAFRDAVDLALLQDGRAGGEGGPFVLFVDLDDFKYVNDGFGHGAGDDVLTATADRLRETVGTAGLCARLGGDEFAVLLPATTTDVAESLARAVVDAVTAPVAVVTGVAEMAAEEVQVGCSVGVAHCAGATGGVDEVVQRADVAMYSAKTGGGGVAVFGRRSAAAEAEAVLLRELAGATARGQIEVHYQPVVDLAEDADDVSCSGMEALVRWNHPERGLVGPQEFITRAERSGAIHEIGAHVLDQSCRDAAAWTAAGRPLTVHVNVSVAQLADDRLLTVVASCLRRSGLPPEQLVLEITESMVLEAPDALRRVHDLAATGVQIAVDDFGTGYASLTALRRLPVSLVKVDRSFVAGATGNPADLAIIEAVVQMAGRLGVEVVAEGVEEVAQAQLLAAAGAHHAQGFLYATPLPRAAFDEWLATRTPLAPRPVRRRTTAD